MPKIDLAAYKGREQAFVKHCLLGSYLPELGFKVGSAWDTLVYIDAFAGPWGVTREDLSDSSFAVGMTCLRDCMNGLAAKNRNIRALCLFNELKPEPFAKLDAFAKAHDRPGFGVKAFLGAFEDQVDKLNAAVDSSGRNPFKFVFLDPKGWKDIPMSALQPLLVGRSSEVLINLNTKDISRFLEQPTRAESYRRLFGRPEVLEILQEIPMGDNQRAERAVQEYCRSLHKLCGFKYVSQAVIFDPERDEILYYLIYATNHHRGVEVFKDAEVEAANLQVSVRQDVEIAKTGQISLFAANVSSAYGAELRIRYRDLARKKVLQSILESEGSGARYADLFCDAMAFPLVTPDDLLAWLKSLYPHAKLVLDGTGRRQVPVCDKDDRVQVADRTALSSYVRQILSSSTRYASPRY